MFHNEYAGSQFAPLSDQIEMARLIRDNAHYRERAHVAEQRLQRLGSSVGNLASRPVGWRARFARWIGGTA